MGQISHSTARAASHCSVVTQVLTVRTTGRSFTDLTGEARRFIDQEQAVHGALLVFVRHTSASLCIQENADPTVQSDLLRALDLLAPEDSGWQHDDEGPDDMPAHVKALLSGVSLQVPVIEQRLALGTWQAIYLIEHRARPHRREVVLQFTGERAGR